MSRLHTTLRFTRRAGTEFLWGLVVGAGVMGFALAFILWSGAY